MQRSNNKKNKCRNKCPPPIDVIASRTPGQKRVIAAKWDLQSPIFIEIISGFKFSFKTIK